MQAKSRNSSPLPSPRAHASSQTASHSWRLTALTFVGLLAVALLLALPSIKAPFFWDDLHLIRVHTPRELADVWVGTWDTDHIETPGFRPLTAYFNHFRALIFGESVVGQRLFLLVLFAGLLTLAAELARTLFAATFWQRFLAGLMALVHVRSVYHYLWISDGIHLLAGLFVIGAILSLLRGLSSGRGLWLWISGLCVGLALLTREDALVVLPLLVLLGAAFLLRGEAPRPALERARTGLAIYAAALVTLGAACLFWRRTLDPTSLPAPDPAAWLWGLMQTVRNAGDAGFLSQPWPAYSRLLLGWDIWLAALLIGVFGLGRIQRLQVAYWAGAAALAALPLLMSARTNLLLLPVIFWSMLVASVLWGLWRHPSILWRILAAGMLLLALGIPAFASLALQQEQRYGNLDFMCRNASTLYGLTGQATIPAVRAASVQSALEDFGITGLDAFKTRWPTMERSALADGHIGPARGLPFLPRFQFIQQYGTHPRCEPPK